MKNFVWNFVCDFQHWNFHLARQANEYDWLHRFISNSYGSKNKTYYFVVIFFSPVYDGMSNPCVTLGGHPLYGMYDSGTPISLVHHLIGLVVKVSAWRVKDPGFKAHLRRYFFGVESYQWLNNWHSSGYPARHLVLQGQCWDWLARCQYTATGWDGKFGLQLSVTWLDLCLLIPCGTKDCNNTPQANSILAGPL